MAPRTTSSPTQPSSNGAPAKESGTALGDAAAKGGPPQRGFIPASSTDAALGQTSGSHQDGDGAAADTNERDKDVAGNDLPSRCEPADCGAEVQAGSPWEFRPPAPGWPVDGRHFTARLTDGTPIPAERARQILLNAGFSTLVIGTDGHPLYLGRRVRCATPAQRRALLTRYPTCVVHGCEIPATACQVDHVDSWENGQPSDIDRLVLCCAWHNRYKWQHPHRVHISQGDDGRYRYQIARPESLRHDRRPSHNPTAQPPERGP